MKLYLLACLCSTSLAGLRTHYSTPVTFPRAADLDVKNDPDDEDEGVWSYGELGEIMIDGTNEIGDQVLQVWLYVKWRTGGERWADEYWIQNYLQIGDSESINTFIVMTCNAEYTREELGGNSAIVFIGNYYGEQSFKVADNINTNTWERMGSTADVSMEWFRMDDIGLVEDSYAYEYIERTSYQTCTAIAPMYSTINDRFVDEENEVMNKKYWLALEGNPVDVHTGFRVWDEAESEEYERAADATAATYTMHNFGFEKPVIEEELEEVSVTEDLGAACLSAVFMSMSTAIYVLI